MKICLFTVGVLPVPPVKGGAVENLIKLLIDENELYSKVSFTVTSVFDSDAVKISNNYKNTDFFFVKTPSFIKLLDKTIFSLAKIFLNKKSQSFKMIFTRLFYINNCKKYFLANDFDCIVAENHHSLFIVMKNKRMQKKYADKFFYHSHNEPNGDFGCRKQIENCKKIITVSNFISNSYKKVYPDGKAEYVFVPNGIDTEHFSQKFTDDDKHNLRKKYGISDDDFVIIFAGRIVEGKGVIPLSKAFVTLPFTNKRLLIVGSSFFGQSEQSPVQKEMETLLSSCIDRVTFTGFIPYEDIYKFYRMADIAGLVPIWNEPGALTNIEAQASSLPVVTTISGGIPEYSNPESQILLPIDKNLVKNVIEKFTYLYEHPLERKKIGRKNFEFIKQFNKENFYKNFIEAITTPPPRQLDNSSGNKKTSCQSKVAA